MKSKAFLRYYLITALALLGAAAIPFWHFAVMVSRYVHRESHIWFYNYREVLPFTAVTAAILITFLLLPILKNMPLRRKIISASAFALVLFFAVEAVVEAVAVRSYVYKNMAIEMRSPFFFGDPIDLSHYDYQAALPASIKTHYYIFSIVLIVAVLHFLCLLHENLFGRNKPGAKPVIVSGVALACYTAAYLLVQVVRYNDYDVLRVTWATVLNIAVCFILAAVAAGLFSASFMRFAGRQKIIPSLVSVATVLALYGAEFALKSGRFYIYAENIVVNILLHTLIIIIPAVVVRLLLGYAYGRIGAGGGRIEAGG
jgi:hypothetical protein